MRGDVIWLLAAVAGCGVGAYLVSARSGGSVSSRESLAKELERQRIGRTVQVTLWRKGDVLDLPVLLTAP